MVRKLFLLTMLTVGVKSYSQQDAQYTQYMYNTETVNPAYAGSRGIMSIFGLYRTQWVGFEGAPKTGTFSINTPIDNSNIGVGFTFVNDQIGPTVNNTISLDFSYTIQISKIYKLSMGVKGTADLFSFEIDKLNPQTPSDFTLQSLHNNFSPNLGAGIYFHSNKSYIGLSIPNFFQTKRFNDYDYAIYKERTNLYLIGGHVFNMTTNIKFKPAFLIKTIEGAPLQLDLSGNFLINNQFMLGSAWRWNAAGSFMVGFQVTDGLYVGYGYDLDTTKLAYYNSGSHEVFLRFELHKRLNRIVSPRFF